MIIMKEKKGYPVTTISGKRVMREDAFWVKSTGKYYEKNVDGFQLQSLETGKPTWYRIDSGVIVPIYGENRWELLRRIESNSKYRKGIIDVKEGNPVYGYYDITKNNSVTVCMKYVERNQSFDVCVSEELAYKLGFEESISDGNLYYKPNIPEKIWNSILSKPGKPQPYPRLSIDYNANEKNKSFRYIYNEYLAYSKGLIIDDSTKDIVSYLGGKSFGLELETSYGMIPEKLLVPLGLVPLRDGSLRERGVEPYEYTTVPLEGLTGLQTIKNICEQMNKRNSISINCSLHLHIGNLPKEDKLYALTSYILGHDLQNEIFEMFPMYKLDPSVIGKEKNYCQMLDSLSLITPCKEIFNPEKNYEEELQKCFNVLFSFMCDGKVGGESNDWNIKKCVHPLDPNGQAKWNIHSRYLWKNLVPLVFSSARTVEYRIHTPTLNFTKITNWLFICIAISRYAEKYPKEILTRNRRSKRDRITLDKVLKEYETNFGQFTEPTELGIQIYQYLTTYVEFRKKAMLEAAKNNDPIANNIEFASDSKFTFENNGVKTLY